MHILASTLPALSPLVKEEFQLTDTAVGGLSFAFAAAIGLGSIPLGMLSDRYDGIKQISLGFFSTAILSWSTRIPIFLIEGGLGPDLAVMMTCVFTREGR